MSALARRYARAVVGVVSEQGGTEALPSLQAGLESFRDACNVSDELRQVLFNPMFKPSREAVVTALLEKLDLIPVVRRLVLLLTKNERVTILDDLIVEVQRLVDEAHGRLRARVVSAIAPSEQQMHRIEAALSKRMGQPVVVDISVDSTILGGLVCQVGDLTLDNSFKRQLEILRERL